MKLNPDGSMSVSLRAVHPSCCSYAVSDLRDLLSGSGGAVKTQELRAQDRCWTCREPFRSNSLVAFEPVLE